MQVAAKMMISSGLLTREQYERVQGLFLDPTFNYPSGTMFAAWGKKPIAR
jgi:hypothetical protein